MERDLAQNELRFGPKWNAFWPKMERDLAQNGKRLSAKRVTFQRQTFSVKYSNVKQQTKENHELHVFALIRLLPILPITRVIRENEG